MSIKGSGPIASFVRFVVCGGGTGLASSAALVWLSDTMPIAAANAVITVLSTLLANELHSRITFGSGRASMRVHLESTGTAVVCYLFTTAAMMALDAMTTAPGTLTEQAVYLGASGLAGIGRFVALRVFVFGRRRMAAPVATPMHATVLGRDAVAVAA